MTFYIVVISNNISLDFMRYQCLSGLCILGLGLLIRLQKTYEFSVKYTSSDLVKLRMQYRWISARALF